MNPLTKSHTIERSTSYWSLGAYCTGFSEKGFCLFCSDWVKVCSAFLLFKRPQSLSVLPIWAVVYGRPDFYVEQKPDLPGSDLRRSLCCGSNKTRWSCTDIQVFSSEYTSAFRALLTAPKAKWSRSSYSEKQSVPWRARGKHKWALVSVEAGKHNRLQEWEYCGKLAGATLSSYDFCFPFISYLVIEISSQCLFREQFFP